MSQEPKKVGLLIGTEQEWPAAFLAAINQKEGFFGDFVKIGPTYMDEPLEYDIIIDRISHDIPYYRAYLKFAVLNGAYLINDPLTKAIDQKFFSTVLVNKLGLTSPRTAVLPNKDLDIDSGPDTFRNLKYPMDWNEIINYVGVPAIFKDIKNGGRRAVYRVDNVDDLILYYEQSGTRTAILQQIIESETHIHSFVIGQEKVLHLHYSLAERAYLPQIGLNDPEKEAKLTEQALKITKAYHYDINMVEFVMREDEIFVINGTNPAPEMNTKLMTAEQFSWCVDETVELVVNKSQGTRSQKEFFFE